MGVAGGEFNQAEFQLGLVVCVDDDLVDYRVLAQSSDQRLGTDAEIDRVVQAVIDYEQDGIDAMLELGFADLDDIGEGGGNNIVVGSFIHRHVVHTDSQEGLLYCVNPAPLPESEIHEFLELRASELYQVFLEQLARQKNRYLDPWG